MRRYLAPSGVVHQDVEPAPTEIHLIDHAVDVFLIGYVGLNRKGLAAPRCDGFDDFLCGFTRRTVVHGDAGALCGEKLADGASHPGAAAGDESGFALQLHRKRLL